MTVHGRVPKVQGASLATRRRAGWWQIRLRSPLLCGACRSLGTRQWLRAGWGATKHISRWRHLDCREDGCVPRCRCARWLCWSTQAAGRCKRKAAAREAPSLGSQTWTCPLTVGCQKGSRGAAGLQWAGKEGSGEDPAGAGRLPWAEGHSQPAWSCACRHGAQVHHHRQAELAPSRASLRLRCSQVSAHVWEQGGPREAARSPGTLACGSPRWPCLPSHQL